MNISFKNQVALVTGAASGLGLATATAFAESGAAVVLADWNEEAVRAATDGLGTGWFAADAANVKPGSNVVVVGDGAVGLLGVLSAKQMGAQRIMVMSRHEKRQKL